MSIAAQVEAALAPKRCRFGRVLADLPDTDRKAILDGLDGNLSATDAARILSANGFSVNEKAVRVHRSNDCCCA